MSTEQSALAWDLRVGTRQRTLAPLLGGMETATLTGGIRRRRLKVGTALAHIASVPPTWASLYAGRAPWQIARVTVM